MDSTTIEYLRMLVAGHDRGEWTAEQVVERLHQVIDPQRIAGARPFADLQSTGLLWYLNRTALWPRGFALALMHDGGAIVGWDLVGDGTEPITSGSPETEGDRLAAVERLLAEHRR